MASSNTWKHYVQSLATNEDADKNLSAFSKDSNFNDLANVSAQIKINFHADKNTSILAKVQISDDVISYHSITNLDCSRARPHNKIVGLLGVLVSYPRRLQ